jgi:hypothetical protein
MIRQTMMIAYVFIASLLVLCVSVEGGNIRGQTDRILKKEDKENGDNDGGEGTVVTTTIAPQPSPTNPPTPSQYETFLKNTCAGQAFSLNFCMGGTTVPPALQEDCYRCIFSKTTVGSSFVNSCLNVCGGSDGLCKPEAVTLLNCGNGRISEPTTQPQVVVVVPADTNQIPILVPIPIPSPASTPPPQGTTTTSNPPVDNFTTMDNCPLDLPTSGDQCIVPSGFLYQSCDYTAATTTTMTMTRSGGQRVPRCSCRADEGLFMCYTVPFLPPTPAPTQQPVTVAVTTQSPTTTMPILAPIAAPITAPITMTPSTIEPIEPIEPIESTPPPVPSSQLKNDLPPHCYVAGMEDNIQQLPQTGDSCFVPDDIEYGNCVFGVNDPDGVYLYIVYRCLCNPRKLPDETFLDKFICNVIINEPF